MTAQGRLLWSCSPLLVMAPLLAAQPTATTGEIQGTVFDESGMAVSGVAVTVRQAQTGFERRASSGPHGEFRLTLLPPGSYVLRAGKEGFAQLVRDGLTLQTGGGLFLDVRLQVAAPGQTVVVTAAAPPLDTGRTLPVTTFDERSIAFLPLNGRRFQDLALLTPGAVATEPGLVGLGGQRGVNTAFTVDGVSYDEPFFGGVRGSENPESVSLRYTISQEAIEELQVTNAGYRAEFGRSGGGVVSAITKSGGNEIHGSAFWFFRNEGLTGDDPFGRPPDDFSQQQFGASLGGPLRRDRTHFFLAYDQQLRDNLFAVELLSDPTGLPGFEGEEGTYLQTSDITTALVRIDHRLNDRHRLWARYNFSHHRAENAISTTPTSSTVANSSLDRDTTHTAVAELSSVWRQGRVNLLRLQWSREDRPREPNTLDPTVFVNGLGTTGRVIFMPALEKDDRFQLVDSFALTRGPHSIRLGADVNLTHTQQPFFLPLSGGLYGFFSADDYRRTLATGEQAWAVFIQGFGRPGFDIWQTELAAWAQDTWRVGSRVTVDYGLRYEAQFQPPPDTPNPDLPGSDRIPSDTTMLAPRVGVAWETGKDRRGVVRGNAGLYYARTPAILLAGPITINGRGQEVLSFAPGTPGAPTFPGILEEAPPAAIAPPADVHVFAPEFRNPRALQLSLGFEREVWPSLVLSADFVSSWTWRLERLLDTNLRPAEGRAPDGRLVYPSDRPNPEFRAVLQRESTARSRYHAITAGIRKTRTTGRRWFNRGLQLQVFYTYARSRDDDSNERDPFFVWYQDWQDLGAEYGGSDTDVRHGLVASGLWSLAWDLDVAVAWIARSGRPYSHFSGFDLNHDGAQGNDRQFVSGSDTGRNAFRQPSFRRLDLRLSKAVRLGGARRLELAVDLFNAFDSTNLIVPYDNQLFDAGPGGVNPSLDQPTAQLGEPRAVQLSARLRF